MGLLEPPPSERPQNDQVRTTEVLVCSKVSDLLCLIVRLLEDDFYQYNTYNYVPTKLTPLTEMCRPIRSVRHDFVGLRSLKKDKLLPIRQVRV